MLTTYFTRERTCTTYYAGPAGPYLDDFSPTTLTLGIFSAKNENAIAAST